MSDVTTTPLPPHLWAASANFYDPWAELIELRAENARLSAMLVTDDLTGLANRRGWQQAIMAEQDRLKRGASAGGLVILIDLDRFKAINDTLGHAAGDLALCQVAKTLTDSIRPMDTAARLGGDEFVVLLTNVAPERAVPRAQRFSLQLNKAGFVWDEKLIPIGASVGVHPLSGDDDVNDVLKHADTLMYAQKRRALPTPPHGVFPVS
jgi:diguanylate cyclase (GGDEF)-like protein